MADFTHSLLAAEGACLTCQERRRRQGKKDQGPPQVSIAETPWGGSGQQEVSGRCFLDQSVISSSGWFIGRLDQEALSCAEATQEAPPGQDERKGKRKVEWN